MKEKEENKIIKTEDEMGQVALPFNKDQFSNFLVSLLGKPQTITKRFEGDFEIDLDTLIKLYEIINQRFYQQNEGKLIQFRATVYYSDNSSTTLNGFEHLVHYNEPHPLVVEAIHLTWQYVVKFKDKDAFEKQEINISFITPSDRPRRYDFEDDPFFIIGGQGQITIRINHTARTWGADIEALLSRHLEKLISKDKKIVKYLRYNKEEINQVLRIVLMGISLGVIIYKFNGLISSETNSIILNKFYFSSGIFLVIIYLFSYAVEVLLDRIRVYARECYILITQETIKKKEKDKAKYRMKWLKYIGTLVVTILTGVAANYIFAYLTSN